MRARKYGECINRIAYHARAVLERESKERLHYIARDLISQGDTERWEVIIPHHSPIRFEPSKDDPRFRPDIYCTLKSIPGPAVWVEQSVVIRVWSERQEWSFRRDWDSGRLEGELAASNNRRVYCAIHFDRALPKAPEPVFHAQFGGWSEDPKEFRWYPDGIDVPRLPSCPMDLVLAIQFVLSNYFSELHNQKRREREWTTILAEVEDFVAREYFERASRHFTSRRQQTLMDSFWSA